MIEAKSLTKTHRGADTAAVRGIDFQVTRGETFGFLGPNGAGKSSTMRMIACVSPPTSGNLRVLDLDPVVDGSQIRARIGVVPQEDALDRELTVRENLLVYGRYFGLSRSILRERAAELLAFAQLENRGASLVDTLSGGMRRRLTIARSLINRPELLLLDEPTTGLDPQARHLLWERLFELKERGVTLILTTHYMDEAEQLCDRLVVMDSGLIVAEGTPRELIDKHVGSEIVELRFSAGDRSSGVSLVQRISRRHTEDRVQVLPDRTVVYTDRGDEVVAAVHAHGITPASSIVRRTTLEDVFLTLTGHGLSD